MKKERATYLHHLSSAMHNMKALIHLCCLHPMLAPLTCDLTLNLVATLVSKVTLLMHLLLLQSNRGLAWPIRLQLISLVSLTPVWLVPLMNLFITLLCHLSLTHPCTLGLDPIGILCMTMPNLMINRSQGLKL
jgi:hypothetical protein